MKSGLVLLPNNSFSPSAATDLLPASVSQSIHEQCQSPVLHLVMPVHRSQELITTIPLIWNLKMMRSYQDNAVGALLISMLLEMISKIGSNIRATIFGKIKGRLLLKALSKLSWKVMLSPIIRKFA
jgi:hypothetical protein